MNLVFFRADVLNSGHLCDRLKRMMIANDNIHVRTPANDRRINSAERVLSEILVETTRRGFYGTAGVELSIQDGAIQTIRRRVERIEK